MGRTPRWRRLAVSGWKSQELKGGPESMRHAFSGGGWQHRVAGGGIIKPISLGLFVPPLPNCQLANWSTNDASFWSTEPLSLWDSSTSGPCPSPGPSPKSIQSSPKP